MFFFNLVFSIALHRDKTSACTHIHTNGQFSLQWSSQASFLECRRKLAWTHANTGRTCKLYTRDEIRTLAPVDCEADVLTSCTVHCVMWPSKNLWKVYFPSYRLVVNSQYSQNYGNVFFCCCWGFCFVFLQHKSLANAN